MNINWQQVCLNLRRHKSLSEIARQIGADEGTINRLARGDTREPKFSHGIKLLDAHLDYCADRHQQVGAEQ